MPTKLRLGIHLPTKWLARQQRRIRSVSPTWNGTDICDESKRELSISTDLVVVSEANTSQVDEGGKIVGKIADIGDQARPAIRAIWFLYTERLTRMKDASEQSRIDTIIAEAVLATDARRVAAASPKNVFFMIVSFLALVCSMQS